MALKRGMRERTSQSVFLMLQLICGRQPQLNIAYELFCGEGGFLTRQDCIDELATYRRESEKGFESLTLLNSEVCYLLVT
jgi:hypothetical protein